MKKALICLLFSGLVFGVSGTGLAANTATQVITLTIAAIDEIAVSSGAVSLTINSATAGSQPAATNASTTYALTTNGSNRKITGAITTGGDMPANTSLQVALVPPTGGTSTGTIALTTVAQDLVTGITTVAESGHTITYTFNATVAVAPQSFSRTVTLTLTP